MKILALDPALVCGYAHSDGASGTWNLADGGTGHNGLRLVRFRVHLRRALALWPTELIAYEDAGFGSPNPNIQAMHNELRGIIKLVAAEAGGVTTVGYVPTSIKKFATGDGRAKKPAMIAAYARHYPQQQIIDDNHADALWLLRFAEHRASEEQTHGVAITKKKRRAPLRR